MAVTPPVCDFGWPMPAFKLPTENGEFCTNSTISGAFGTKGSLIIFMCNHCPYVRSVLDRILRDVRDLQKLGISVIAISSNDVVAYPQDGPKAMAKLAADENFTMPYLYDKDQAVAKAFGAVCTPDFFGFDADGGLQYRGRLDASRKEAGPADLRRDLFEAMKQVAETGKGPGDQIPSMGCSIKWKEEP